MPIIVFYHKRRRSVNENVCSASLDVLNRGTSRIHSHRGGHAMNRFRQRVSLWWRSVRANHPKSARRHKPARRRASARKGGRTAKFPTRFVVISLIVVTVFILGNRYVVNHLRPIITQMARVEVDQLAARLINQAINDKISEDGVTYGDLVYFEKDIYGQITALKTDIISVNRLKADITEEVLRSIENADTSGIAIPIGNLINSDLFGGRGPRIPLKIVPLGTVSANFTNQFSEAGINQTRHQIMMDVSVEISVLLPGYDIGTQVATQVSIAETVIVGSVPDSYFTMQDII